MDRTVVVRLRANVDQYTSAMAKARGETEKVAAAGGSSFDKLQPKMAALGPQLTKSVTLPLVLAGGAAIKLSQDFETTFGQMVGLAGVSASEVDGLKESVLGLAGETARSPQELAEALYFIRSSGLEGAAAMDALEYSAKAAAAGLGSAVGVADAVTSAMNAYAREGLTAADATDALVAAVRVGKVEASQMAPQLGRLLPIAAELGVGFDETAGAVAFLSRTSGDAALSATQLNGVLTKLLEPGMKGREALAAVGLSVEDLRKAVAEQGLVPALEMLRDRLAEGGMEFSAFAEDQQFIQGALSLTGDNAEAAAEAIGQVSDSAGSTDQALAAMAETAGFKNKQAFVELQAALISFGDVLAPILSTVIGFGADLLGVFTSLPEPVQTLALAIAGVAAAAGPVMSMVGPLASGFKRLNEVVVTLASGFGYSSTGAGALSKALGPIGAALTAATAAYLIFKDAVSDGLKADLAEVAEFATSTAEELAWAFTNLKFEDPEGLEEFFDLMTTGGREGLGVLQRLRDELDRQGVSTTEVDAAIAENIALTGEKAETDTAAAAATAGLTVETLNAVQALRDHADALKAQFDPIFAMQDAILDEAEAQAALTAAIKEHGAGSTEAAVAEQELFRAIVDTDGAALSLKAAMDEGTVSLAEARTQLDTWVASGRLTKEQADRIAWSLGIAHGKAEAYSGKYTADLTVNDQASGKLDSILSKIQAIVNEGGTVSVFAYGALLAAGGGDVGGLASSRIGKRPGPTDSIHMLVAPNEYIVQASAVQRLGVPFLDAINAGAMPAGYAPGPAMFSGSGGGGVTLVVNTTIQARSDDPNRLAAVASDAIVVATRRGLASLTG